MKRKIALIFGTRPEVIKLFPLIQLNKELKQFEFLLISTAQQKNLLEIALKEFNIKPEVSLKSIYGEGMTTSLGVMLSQLGTILSNSKPDLVVVQGDTTTAFAGACAGFLNRIPVAHIEAGLRSGTRTRPFPEEVFRQAISRFSNLHFAPTKDAVQNLLLENINEESIFHVGNTIVDSLKLQISNIEVEAREPNTVNFLVTLHRRENFEFGIKEVCLGIKKFSREKNDVIFNIVIHSNPVARKEIEHILQNTSGISLLNGTTRREFIKALIKSDCVITDSGGVQEESFLLGKKLFIARTETERPEVLYGDSEILELERNLIADRLQRFYIDQISKIKDVETQIVFDEKTILGNGESADRIFSILEEFFENYMG